MFCCTERYVFDFDKNGINMSGPFLILIIKMENHSEEASELVAADETRYKLLPQKSKNRCEIEYQLFKSG